MAEAENADAHLIRRGLIQWRPSPLGAHGVVMPHLPQMHQAGHHDVFGHARGEIGVDDPADRHIRQGWITQKRINARAKIMDRRKVGQPREQPRLRLPDNGMADRAGIEWRARIDEAALGRSGLEAGDPGRRIPAGYGDEDAHVVNSSSPILLPCGGGNDTRQGPDMKTALGIISGTSMDAIDIALLRSDGRATVEPLGGAAYPYPASLKALLLETLADPSIAEREPLEALETAVTDAFAEAVRDFMDVRGLAPGDIDLIGLHGQTIWHRPERRFTRQLGDGARLAAMLGVPVVNRFRHADVAAGGQGAPLVPLYHAALASALPGPLVVLNLGGVANITFLDGETIIACDTGPASALIDDAMRRHFGREYDEGGRVAASGQVDPAMLATLMQNPFFVAPPPKSLDRNDFHARAAALHGLAPDDEVATLTAFTIEATAAILRFLPRMPQRWLVTGGGRHNQALMAGFARRLGVAVEPVESVGWNGDLLEAECFGYLAIRSRLGLPLSLPTTTGVPGPMPGGVFWPV